MPIRAIPIHEPLGDDPELLLSRQQYLFAVARKTPWVPESLSKLNNESELKTWAQGQRVNFLDGWLLSAAATSFSFWNANGYDGLLRMPARAINLPEHGVPKSLILELQWRPDKGQTLAAFRREAEALLDKYCRESEAAWGKQKKMPAGRGQQSRDSLEFLALYQANETRDPNDRLYRRLTRTAKHIHLTLRPKNNRTK